MDEYREEVERLARERSGEPFYNSSIDHAAVIVEKMFRHAKQEVSIITKHLNGRVFGQDEVVTEAQGFLSNANHKLRILIEDDVSSISEGHPLAIVLRKHPNSHEVRKIPDNLLGKVNYHFTLADEDSYRFEPNKSEWIAVAAFGDKIGAKRMREVFNILWGASEVVELPVTA